MDPARPGSALAVLTQFPGVVGHAAPTASVPLVCRFVPHDQWFLTHLPSYYQGKDVKNHILSKCLNLTYTPPEPPRLLVDPNREQRPPSPITFAPHPSARPASPILFANVVRPKTSVVMSSDEDAESVDWDDTLSATKSMSDGDGFSDGGRSRPRHMYSEDESVDEGGPPQGGGRVLPMKTSPAPPSRGKSRVYTEPQDPKIVPKIAHLSFALVRFSTGQVLEDETRLSEQSIHPHELLELHLSFVSLRKASRSTTIIPATPKFPFPLLNPPSRTVNSKSKRAQARLQELIAAHSIRIVRLPRASPHAYVLPYWEGWVRILRYVCRDEADYVYGGHRMVPGGGSGSSKAKITPGPPQYGNGGWVAQGLYDLNAVGEIRENSLDANLALNFGLGGGKPKEYRPRDQLAHDLQALTADSQLQTAKIRSRFEWRDRWLVIRDGWFFLLRDRADTKPTHRFPLNYLFNLRDADRLTESIESAKDTRRPKEQKPRPPSNNGHHPPMSPRAREKAPEPPTFHSIRSTSSSTHHSVRSTSPNSTLKGAPLTPSTKSRMGKKHGSKSSTTLGDDDAYEEDDEGDRKEVKTPTSRKRQHSIHKLHQQRQHQQRQQQHHHQGRHTSSSNPSHPSSPTPRERYSSPPRPRRDLTDPATRARLNMDTFIPNSKDEADLVGMKIICAKFINPIVSGKGRIPDPFNGYETDDEEEDRAKHPGGGKSHRYSSTGPTLADVVATAPSGIIGMVLEEREEDIVRTKKDSSAKEKSVDATGKGHKSRLSTKGSAQSSLSTDFGTGSKSLAGDRRPSLPILSTPGDARRSKNSLANPTGSVPSITNHAASSSASNPLSFTGLFKGKDKDEKRRQKEAKRAEKEARRAEKEQQEMDANDAQTNSGSSWKISLKGPKRTAKEKESIYSPSSTVGTVEEEHMVISRHQESEAGAAGPSYGRGAEPHSDAERASKRSSIDSERELDFPDPSPIVFKVPGESDEQSPASPAPRFNLDPFLPVPVASSPLAQDSISPTTPEYLRAGVAGPEPSDAGGDSGSDAVSLSSPVFAQDETVNGDEGVDSDTDLGLLRRRRTGYRYGYQAPSVHTLETKESVNTAAMSLDPPSSNFVGGSSTTLENVAVAERNAPDVDGDVKGKKVMVGEQGDEKMRNERRRLARRGEWIIMDFGNDAAYHSLLRILHRHIDEPIVSAFLPDLRHRIAPPPSLSKPTPQVPESTTPPPSPPPKDDFSSPSKLIPPSPSRSSTLRSPTSSLRNRSHSDAQFAPQTRLPRAGPYSDDENDGRQLESPTAYRHPKPLYSVKPSMTVHNGGPGISRPYGLGPFPYPEWRLQAVHRARRAGLGQSNRPLEMMLLGIGGRDASEYFDPGDPAFAVRPSPWSAIQQESDEDDGAEVESGEGGVELPPDSDADVDDDDDDEGNPPFNSFNDDDEERELSELEWQAWMVDLPRQMAIRKQRGIEQPAWLNAQLPPPPHDYYMDANSDFDSDDASDGPPMSLSGEMERVMSRRRAREPCGVVTSKHTSTALPGFVAKDEEHHDNEEHRTYHRVQRYPAASLSAATLSSLSSSESLARHAAAHAGPSGHNNHSVASSTASSPRSAAHSRGHSHSMSSHQNLPHKSSRGSTGRNSLLHHSSSMQTGLRGPGEGSGSQHDGMRKASMPILGGGTTTTTTITEQTFTLNPNSFGMAIQELKAPTDKASIHSQSMPMSSSYDSNRYLADPSHDSSGGPSFPVAQHRAPSNVSLASVSYSQHSLMRNQSTSGRSIQTSAAPPNSSPRPKLTLATSPPAPAPPPLPSAGPGMSVDSLNGQLSPVGSPSTKAASSGRSVARSIIRHVKSGSSLRGGMGLGASGSEESPVPNMPSAIPTSASSSSSANGKGNGQQEGKAKKKKSSAFGMFAGAFP